MIIRQDKNYWKYEVENELSWKFRRDNMYNFTYEQTTSPRFADFHAAQAMVKKRIDLYCIGIR